ncbi:UNVERIFIED_CONTAM: hypothetical protein Sangu_2875900 [Sesamum angustifolium]|uniref:Formin-like protein n=1 Tax=Sesamum angustifolium TaxID=2727405 RepID=A0AAW2INQ2_9LAMI
MDPCPFVRLTVGDLGLKIPMAAKPARSAVHPSSSPCFCTIKLKNFPLQDAIVPYIPLENAPFPDCSSHTLAASFDLCKSDLDRLNGKSSLFSTSKKPQLRISVYSGRRGASCGVSSGRLLGKISVQLDMATAELKPVVFHNGWINVGKKKKSMAQFHMNVKAEPDPRFVFQFDGAPECSPQVFQLRGNIRQPVFTCKFNFRAADRNQRSRSLPSEHISAARSWLSSFGSERERPGKERKGWSITIHDLSGSPVAVASMVTPFVAGPGSDRVTRSNSGCWLILCPGDGTWKPWGRLEAWRERGSADGLGYRQCCHIPVCSPRSSGDFGNALWPYSLYKGFVMSAKVEGEGHSGKIAPLMVEVGVQQVNCMEDAAAFVALSAALDLSMDACRLFSHKLRKELCPPQDLLF